MWKTLFPIIHRFTAGSTATPGCKLLELKLVTSFICADVTLKVSYAPGFTLKTTHQCFSIEYSQVHIVIVASSRTKPKNRESDRKGGKMASIFNTRTILSFYHILKCNKMAFLCLTWHFISMSKNTSSPSGCSAPSSGYREGASVLAAGAASQIGINYNLRQNLNWKDGTWWTCWEDWACAGGGLYMRRAGGAET